MGVGIQTTQDAKSMIRFTLKCYVSILLNHLTPIPADVLNTEIYK